MCTEPELLKVKVPMIFLGKVGFSPPREGRYIMFWKLPFSYISCMQYFDWTIGAPLDWSLLARNTTRGGPGGQLDWSMRISVVSKGPVMVQPLP